MIDDIRKLIISYLTMAKEIYGLPILWTLFSLGVTGFVSSIVYLWT